MTSRLRTTAQPFLLLSSLQTHMSRTSNGLEHCLKMVLYLNRVLRILLVLWRLRRRRIASPTIRAVVSLATLQYLNSLYRLSIRRRKPWFPRQIYIPSKSPNYPRHPVWEIRATYVSWDTLPLGTQQLSAEALTPDSPLVFSPALSEPWRITATRLCCI